MDKHPAAAPVTVFVCTNERDPDHPVPCCGRRGGGGLRTALKDLVHRHGLQRQIEVYRAGCLGSCQDGPLLVIFPGGHRYTGVTEKDLPRLLDELVLLLPDS